MLLACLAPRPFPSSSYFDEVHYVPAARKHAATDPDQPRASAVRQRSDRRLIHLLGDRPLAWRLSRASVRRAGPVRLWPAGLACGAAAAGRRSPHGRCWPPTSCGSSKAASPCSTWSRRACAWSACGSSQRAIARPHQQRPARLRLVACGRRAGAVARRQVEQRPGADDAGLCSFYLCLRTRRVSRPRAIPLGARGFAGPFARHFAGRSVVLARPAAAGRSTG